MPDPILGTVPLQNQWPTLDPFLFCAHHNDSYPAGDAQMAPQASLSGRNLGSDFGGKDGWSMYHGRTVPGFPRHPHRGFETVTIVRQGFIDHSDSLGAHARFGEGDVQWMTAGSGVVHSEMFPLRNQDGANPLELFQVWLNLPSQDKMVPPYFTMFWDQQIPRLQAPGVRVAMYVGELGEQAPPSPPPHSWAARAQSGVAIWTIALEAGAQWELPAAQAGLSRVLYFFEGETLEVAGRGAPSRTVQTRTGVQLDSSQAVSLRAGGAPVQCLLLQGRPIGEPVVRHGPYVMNTPEEIRQTMRDFHQTGFGGWPWQQDAPVHALERGRFAVHADGRTEGP